MFESHRLSNFILIRHLMTSRYLNSMNMNMSLGEHIVYVIPQAKLPIIVLGSADEQVHTTKV